MNWFYCPRDPGCTTYVMSTHEVFVHADNFAKPIPAENLTATDEITIEVKGETTLTSIPSEGSFKIYNLAGHNLYAGVLSDVMTLTGKDFTLNITFALDAGVFAPGSWVEWGLDIFQQKSGTDEAMCIEFADKEYLKFEENTVSPPFVQYCKDNGDGTFTKDTIPIVNHVIPSESCSPGCDLKWYYCPRDPGCVTYTMSADSVVVDVIDPLTIKAGDVANLIVKVTTSLKSVPQEGSFRIYALAGGNADGGALSDVMTITSCGQLGCYYTLDIKDFPITPTMFTAQGWFEFGLDIFQKSSGSDEGMCIEVANPAYVSYIDTPRPFGSPFVLECKPGDWGHFMSDPNYPEIVSDATCKLL